MILLDNKMTLISTKALSRIGKPDYIGLLLRSDGTKLKMIASDSSEPRAFRIDHFLPKVAGEGATQFILCRNPPEYQVLLPKPVDHFLELHGVQLDPTALLFDLEEAIPRNIEEVLRASTIIITPPGWSGLDS